MECPSHPDGAACRGAGDRNLAALHRSLGQRRTSAPHAPVVCPSGVGRSGWLGRERFQEWRAPARCRDRRRECRVSLRRRDCRRSSDGLGGLSRYQQQGATRAARRDRASPGAAFRCALATGVRAHELLQCLRCGATPRHGDPARRCRGHPHHRLGRRGRAWPGRCAVWKSTDRTLLCFGRTGRRRAGGAHPAAASESRLRGQPGWTHASGNFDRHCADDSRTGAAGALASGPRGRYRSPGKPARRSAELRGAGEADAGRIGRGP